MPPKEKQPVINIQLNPRIGIRSQYLLPPVVLLNLLGVMTEFFQAFA